MTFWFERTRTDLLTSTIIRTVGSVVWRFCGCGGRIVTGTAPEKNYIKFKRFLNNEFLLRKAPTTFCPLILRKNNPQ